MERLFEGKVALVTGGASGLGQAAAVSYALNGAKVIVSDTIDNDTVARITAKGGEACFIKTDVGKAIECKKLVEKTIDTYGKIDIAFNNAGMPTETNNVAAISLRRPEKIIGVNLHGVFYCMKYEIEAMLRQSNGIIINTASISGVAGFAFFSGYVASKSVGVDLTQNVFPDYFDKGIRINCLVPGFINTLLPDIPGKKSKEALYLKNPKGRLMRVDEVAALVIWLSSEKASYATGGYYPMGGGYLAN